MTNLFIDTETRSKINLKTAGLHRYAEDAKIVLLQWAVDDGQIYVENVLENGFSADFSQAWIKATRLLAHNAEFDATMLGLYLKGAESDPRWYCTQAQARRHSLPGALQALCDIFRISADKSKSREGHQAMLLFCKPQKNGTWATKQSHPDQWEIYWEYARLDIAAMRALHYKMPKWNDTPFELAVWRLDQAINRRGFAVDVDFATKAVALLGETRQKFNEDALEMSGGVVDKTTRSTLLLNYILAEHGVDLPNCQKDTLERRIADESLPQSVRDLLVLRLEAAKTSTGKYKALLNAVCTDGRLRGALTYCGASRTGRWAGKVFQPQNLKRRDKFVSQQEIDDAITATKLEILDLVTTHPTSAILSNAVRGCIVAPPDKKLLVADYASIEGRIVAWLAGEEWKLQAYRAYDRKEGPDLYNVAYATAFGKSPDEVDKNTERPIGKVMELLLGFGGGVSAIVTGSITYNVDLHKMTETAWPIVPAEIREETARMWVWAKGKRQTCGLPEDVFKACDAVKRMWRITNAEIAQLWEDLEKAVRYTIQTDITQVVGKLVVMKSGSWLRIMLPSGRFLCYPSARVEDDKITYMGQNPYTKQWSRLTTYGGKLVENATQAVSADLLRHALVKYDDWGGTVLHTHDEIVAEGSDLKELFLCMEAVPKWATGLPLAVAGFEASRYRKE